MSNTLVPPPPYSTPFVDRNEIITPVWARWLNQLFLRAGGLNAPSNNQFTDTTTLQAEVTTLQGQVSSIDSQITAIDSTTSDLAKGIASLTVGRQL